MKKTVFLIAVLIVISVLFASCQSMIDDIIGKIDDVISTADIKTKDEPTTDYTSFIEPVTTAQLITENTTEAETNNLIAQRPNKNGYDTSKKKSYSMAGASFEMPLYFEYGTSNSKDDVYYFYAETDGKVAFIMVTSWDGENYSQKEFEEDIKNKSLQNLWMEGIMSGAAYEIFDNKEIMVDGQKCCLFTYSSTINSTPVTGSIFFIYIQESDNVLTLNLIQSTNTQYLYDNDFEKIVRSTKINRTQTANDTSPAQSTSVTTGENNALTRAKSYLKSMSFSYEGLIEQLEYEGFSCEEAKYGADHCGANWKEQALSKAKSYLRSLSFSYKGLVEQLEYEGFTSEEAKYGADHCGANWKEQALSIAKSYLKSMSFSYKGLVEQLEYEGFTSEEAKYGADHCGANWKEQAAEKAKSYLSLMSFSRQSLIEQLEYEGFTHEQAIYGVEANGF